MESKEPIFLWLKQIKKWKKVNLRRILLPLAIGLPLQQEICNFDAESHS